MPPSERSNNCQGVFREEIKEHRDSYYVTYQPADSLFGYALLQLTVLTEKFEPVAICKLLEQELEQWLKRFSVPIMATAWDMSEDGIANPDKKESILMGYVDSTGGIVRKWGVIKIIELPPDQCDPAYLARVYSSVPFKLQEEVRKTAARKWRTTAMVANTIVLFIVVIPVLIELVGLGIAWVGYLLSAISILKGFYEIGKGLGWVKPSRRQKEKEEEERRKNHYFYHCERNPEGFNRLKIENFRRDAIERTRKESDEVHTSHTPLRRSKDAAGQPS